MTSQLKFGRWWGLLMLAVLAVVTAACGAAAPAPSGVARQEAVKPAVAPIPAATAAPAAANAPAQPGMDYAGEGAIDDILKRAADEAHAQERVIVYTGNMSLVVKETGEAIKAITALVGEQGGYVAGSNVYEASGTLRGTITIRVPAEKYEDTLAGLRALSVRVEREASNTQDVTEEFVDLQARKTNMQAAEKALQDLLEERKKVGSTADILDVYRELTNIRGQIEQIEGRLRYLTNQAALSTITIELIPSAVYQPVNVGGWELQGTAKEAAQALISALQGLVKFSIWLIIFIVPLLLVLLLPVVVVIWIIRWWWKRRKAHKPAK